ncbi:MAG: hypothetical protein KatS3mg129_2965 [Leptospiraceae bacterium]|nr:MAG: hypothetical protein KatS3mg129_2965 [Leptospiraceae bacterium]
MNYIYFLFLECLIIFPFVIGFFIKEKLKLEEWQKKQLSERMLRINLIYFEPFIIIWYIGKLEFNLSTLYLPIGGLFLVFLGFLFGYLLSIPYSLRNRITLIVNTSLANHGYTMGGIICYFILGEKGLSKALIFISYFYFYLYGFLFPWIQKKQNYYIKNQSFSIKQKIKDYRLFPLYGLILGILIFIFQLPLPQSFYLSYIIQIMVYISIIIYYFSLGINLEFKKLSLRKNNIVKKILLIKFIIIPLITFIVLKIIPENLLSLFDKKVIFIMSFMPGAVYSIVSSIIFNLNIQLTIQIFVWSTITFLIGILPLLYLFLIKLF